MKRTFLLKTMLLLCALIAGSSSVWAEYSKVMELDLTTKSYGASAYNTSTAYGDWTIVNGANNNKGWAYFKMGGKQTTITNYNPCYIYSTAAATDKVDKITVHLPAGSLSTSGMSVNSWGVYVYSNSDMSNLIDYVAGGTITTSEGSFDFTPSDGKTWAKNYYYKVSWDLANTSTTNGIVFVDKITLYKEVVAYTITPAVNNGAMGSAVVNDATITATPNDGYRVISGDGGYTVTSGTATVINNGDNTFTVTPTSDCTVQVNFEAIPTYTLSSVVSPTAAAGTVTFGTATVREGASTTATAAAGYKFIGWSITGTGASLSSTSTNPTTVTIGTANATVTATFEAVPTHAITYSVNGNETIVNVEENAAIDLSAPASGIPAGYVFRGWRTATLSETDTDPNDYVTAATSTTDITYYAVMAVKTATLPDTYEKLASNSFDANATYVIGAVQSGDDNTMWYLYSYENVDQNISWGVMTKTPNTIVPTTFTLSGTADALVAQDNSGNYLKGLSTGKFYMSSTSVNVYLNSDGAIKASSDGYLLRHNYNNGSGGLRWYSGTTGQQAYFYKVVKNATFANYCTSLPSNIILEPHTTYLTLTSKYPLDFTSVSYLTAYIVKDNNVTDNEVTMTQVNKVPANTGLVLNASSTVYPISVPVLNGAADDMAGNLMAGSAFTTTAVAENAGYILKDGVFQPSSGGDLPAGKAYLNIHVNSSARALTMNFEEPVVTGISNNTRETITNNRYYNLNGQRVSKPTKGMYIQNGKKVVVK